MNFIMPKKGTLERIFVDVAYALNRPVTFEDFIGTGITEENIDQVVQNLRNNMFESEDDHLIRKDS